MPSRTPHRLLSLVSLLVLGTTLAGPARAKPCDRLVVDEVDAFGERVHGGFIWLDLGHYNALGIREQDGEMVLESMWARRGVMDLAPPAGTEVQVALEDGTVVTTSTAGPTEPVSNANQTMAFTQWKLVTPLAAEDLQKLASTPVTAVRTEFGEQPLTLELRPKRQKRFQELAACMVPDDPDRARP